MLPLEGLGRPGAIFELFFEARFFAKTHPSEYSNNETNEKLQCEGPGMLPLEGSRGVWGYF